MYDHICPECKKLCRHLNGLYLKKRQLCGNCLAKSEVESKRKKNMYLYVVFPLLACIAISLFLIFSLDRGTIPGNAAIVIVVCLLILTAAFYDGTTVE